MPPLRRFIRFHLKPYLPGTLFGALLFTLSNSLQALIFLSLKLMFDNQFGMGPVPAPPPPVVMEQATVPAGQVKASVGFGEQAKASPAPATQPVIKISPKIDRFLPSQETIRSNILFIPFLIAALFFLRGLFTYAGTILVARSGSKAVKELRERIFAGVVLQDPVFFHVHPVGELMNRVLGDVNAVQNLASSQISELLKQSSMALIMAVFIIKMDWHFALAILLFFPCVFLPIRYFSKTVRRQGHKAQGSQDSLLQRLKEVLSNMRVVKAFAREDYETLRFKTLSHGLYRLNMRVVRIQGLSSPVMETVGGIMLACLAMYGALNIKAGTMTGGGFLITLLAIYQLYDPLRILTRSYADLQLSSIALDRIFSLLDSKPSIVAPPVPTAVPVRPGVLCFEGVNFSYGKGEVLRGIDLTVCSGETVALVGGSGGGKTSLVNLVPRFYDPTAGRITLDGIDIREFDPRELRTRIGIVTQETLLFLDTVHDNIAYGMTASREAVEAAAKKAFAHDFIMEMPNGYDSLMAETGATLSGGQRQRIAIARALLQDPPILILDEATSALDTESERAVQAALETLMKDRTTIVIAHRLSTIQRATRICALKHGRIVEQGSHEELLAQGGEYERLYNMQFHLAEEV
jgi:subfamily B ATP-binding cassette protein MsbA